MNAVKILSVSSMPAHKLVGLRAQQAILGSTLLPVPSVVLSGAKSLPGVVSHEIDIIPILSHALDLAAAHEQRLYLFVGYLVRPADIDRLVEFIIENRHRLAGVLVDPISGDNSQPYVSQELIAAWPRLLGQANFAFPNLTELKLYSGYEPIDADPWNHISAFESRFPRLSFTVTSFANQKVSGVFLKHGAYRNVIRHNFYEIKLDGAGDVFAAYFLKFNLVQGLCVLNSCKKAIQVTLRHVRHAFRENAAEILI